MMKKKKKSIEIINLDSLSENLEELELYLSEVIKNSGKTPGRLMFACPVIARCVHCNSSEILFAAFENFIATTYCNACKNVFVTVIEA